MRERNVGASDSDRHARRSRPRPANDHADTGLGPDPDYGPDPNAHGSPGADSDTRSNANAYSAPL